MRRSLDVLPKEVRDGSRDRAGLSRSDLDQYDQVVEGMGLRPGGPAPPRALFHWVTKTDDGIHVVDVWETMEDFQRFADEQIGPQSAAAGITEKPEITTHEVHNYFTAG